MKPIILFVTILFWGQPVFAQTEWYSDIVLIQKGMALQKFADDSYALREKTGEDSVSVEKKLYIKEDLWEQAAAYYQELADSFPKSQLLLSALEMKGDIELKLERFEEAAQTYPRIIALCKTDTLRGKRKLGNLLYYAHTAISTIAIENEDYKEAIANLDEAVKYPYVSGCMSCEGFSPQESVRLARLYTDAYLGIQDFKNAYRYLLPAFFHYADTRGIQELSTYVYESLLRKYTRTELLKKYEASWNNYYIERDTNDPRKTTVYIYFLQIKVHIFSMYRIKTKKEIQADVKKYYLNSPLYTILSKDQK